jgi:transposase-like protein
VAQPGVQQYAEDGRLICLDCGRQFKLLAPHLAQAHGTTTAQYREAHQLPRQLSLRAADLSERARQQGADRYRQRTDIREAMERGRTQAADTTAVTSSQETAMRPMVRQARRRGGQGKAEAARRRMLERVQAVGFADLAGYFAARNGWSVASMARELGVSHKTASSWRERSAAERAGE